MCDSVYHLYLSNFFNYISLILPIVFFEAAQAAALGEWAERASSVYHLYFSHFLNHISLFLPIVFLWGGLGAGRVRWVGLFVWFCLISVFVSFCQLYFSDSPDCISLRRLGRWASEVSEPLCPGETEVGVVTRWAPSLLPLPPSIRQIIWNTCIIHKHQTNTNKQNIQTLTILHSI